MVYGVPFHGSVVKFPTIKVAELIFKMQIKVYKWFMDLFSSAHPFEALASQAR